MFVQITVLRLYKPCDKKAGILHMRKQIRRLARGNREAD